MATAPGMSTPGPLASNQIQSDSVDGSATPITRGAPNAEPGPIEGIVHTGSFNTIDQQLMRQWISLLTFNWSVTQAAGTLLFEIEITPKKSHQYMKYLSPMYNIFVGGFDFKSFLNATGFHAGELIFARTPPNIKPSSLTGLADITVFEYQLIDPKNTSMISLHVRDQNPRMYHYMDDEGRDGIGGWFGCWVYAPLATSSTGNQSVTGCVLTKPSYDFSFLQLKPLMLDNTEVPVVDEGAQTIANALMVKDDCNTLASFQTKVDVFVVHPSNQVTPPVSLVGSRDFAGKALHPGSLNAPYRKLSRTSGDNLKKASTEITYAARELQGLPTSSNCLVHLFLSGKPADSGESSLTTFLAKKIPYPGEIQVRASSTGYPSTEIQHGIFDIRSYLEDDRKYPPKLSEESYFSFGIGTGTGLVCAQPSKLAALLRDGKYSSLIAKTQCMIVDMIDTEQQVPIRRLKIYPSGIITTTGTTDQVIYPTQKYKFNFVQFSKQSEPIPGTPRFHQADLLSRWANSSSTIKEE